MKPKLKIALIAGIASLIIGLGLFVFWSLRLGATRKAPQSPEAPGLISPMFKEMYQSYPMTTAPQAIPTPTAKHTPFPSSQSSLLRIDRILESLELGNIAFNAPTSMNLEDLAQIQLLLGLEQSIEDLSKMVTAAGEKEGACIRISDRMEASLSGTSFQITAITPEEQAIPSKGVTEWKWEVKPTNPGRHQLHLTLTALFNVDGISTRRAIRTFDKTIEVEVRWGQRISGFISENWQWLWAVILAPVAGWIWNRLKKRLARKKEVR